MLGVLVVRAIDTLDEMDSDDDFELNSDEQDCSSEEAFLAAWDGIGITAAAQAAILTCTSIIGARTFAPRIDRLGKRLSSAELE